MLIGFKWLNALRVGAQANSVKCDVCDMSDLSLPDRLVWLCQKPQTLGNLADQTGLNYRELWRVLTQLHQQGRVYPKFIDSILHYESKNH